MQAVVWGIILGLSAVFPHQICSFAAFFALIFFRANQQSHRNDRVGALPVSVAFFVMLFNLFSFIPLLDGIMGGDWFLSQSRPLRVLPLVIAGLAKHTRVRENRKNPSEQIVLFTATTCIALLLSERPDLLAAATNWTLIVLAALRLI
jgi:hypothetical protein